MDFPSFLQIYCQQNNRKPYAGSILCIDPGETTGVSYFNLYGMRYWDEIRTPDVDSYTDCFDELLNATDDIIQCIVIEDYRVYSWKTEQHAWSALHTPQIIAATHVLARQKKIPVFKQMAHPVKTFCTDEKLKEWGYWQKGKRHARDAIRHGCYFLLFNVPKVKELNCNG